MAEIVSVEVPSSKKEPAIIEINTAAATGDGPLTAEAFSEQEEKSEVQVEKVEDGKYKLIFSPPSPAVYSLSIKWGDEPITGSLLELNLNHANSKAVTISKPPGANIRPGEKIKIGFDASKAGRGSLTSTCSAEDTGDIPVEVIREGFTSQYIVDFLPPHEDMYNLHVKWAGKNVKGSPFHLDMIPVLPSKVIASGFVVPKEPGGKIELQVCTKGAGNASIKAACTGEKAGEIPVETNKLSPHDYHLTAVTSSEPDKYTFDVTFAGQSIPNSPFIADVVPPLGSAGVEHLATNIPGDHDTHVTLKFDASKVGEGTFRARVAGIVCGPIDSSSELLPSTDHHYQITFKPPCADSYLVDVYWNDSPVPGSPFDVVILDPEKLVFGELRFVNFDVPMELKVDASKAGPGKITATCKGEKTGDLGVYIEDNLAEAGTRKYIISFRPPAYDDYTLSVFFDGQEVKQSPFVVKIQLPDPPCDSIPKSYLFGLSSRKVFFLQEKVTFGVNATDAGEGRLNVKVAGPFSDEDPPEVNINSSDKDPHIYNIEYIPKACGEHRIQLKWNEDLIPDSPVVFTVEDDKDIPSFPMSKPYKIFFATECHPRNVRSFGIHEESENSKDLTIGKRRNGRVALSYTATQPGIHSMYVLIDNSEIPGSPFRVKFVRSDPKACKLLDVPDMAYVGEESSFRVDARKAGTGELHVRARVPLGGSGISTRHEFHNNGFYTIFFAPQIAGAHFFDISWAGEPIFDSPVEIAIEQREPDLQTAKDAASKVHVLKEDLYIFNMCLPSSLPAYICISTGHAGRGKLSLKATGPSEAKISVIDRENGVYTAEVRPVVSGKYTLGIFWNDIHINGSPFKLDFTADKSYLINGLDLESVPFIINVPYTLHLHCPQDKKRELSITCTPTTAASISYKSLDHDQNSYLCEIVPKEVGNHEISIEFDGRDVHNSPHNVQFDPNPDSVVEPNDHLIPLDISIDMSSPIQEPLHPESVPSKIKAIGPGLIDGHVGQEGNFTIETEKAGEGKLEVDVHGPKGAFIINMRRHPENSRTLLARYDPKAVGKYTINILWDGEHIPKSPFFVNISEQSRRVESFAKVDMTIEL